MSTTAHISDAQLNANRQNAALSTGPRSEEAKQRTRLNGLRHGLTGQTIVMPYEDQQVYEDFCAATIADLQPADETERGLAQSIASETWRLNRSRAIEGNIFAIDITVEDEDTDPIVHAALTQAQTFLDHAREIALLSLYAGRIARGVDKTRAELKALQSARQQAYDHALEEAILLQELALSKGETCQHLNQNGIGFSTIEINRLIDRRNRLKEARALFAPQQNPKTSRRKAA